MLVCAISESFPFLEGLHEKENVTFAIISCVV
jgi:hypothetical protein